MAATTLFEIPGTIVVEQYAAEKAVVAGWVSLSTPQFREAIKRGLGECGRLRARSWIVDLTRNPGVPSQEDLAWIGTTAAALAVKHGVRALINVLGSSTLATIGARRWTKSASDGGLATYDCLSLTDALELAAEVASGKAA